MWLEDTAWVWIPVAFAVAGWLVFRVAALRREVSSLQERIGKLERGEVESPAHVEGTARSRSVA